MSVFVGSVDVDRAWEVYYQLADRRHQPGLTLEELRQVIEAALVGKVDAEEEVSVGGMGVHRRAVSPWIAESIVHLCPPKGSGLTPCCHRTPFELPRSDRMSLAFDAVTCGVEVEEHQ